MQVERIPASSSIKVLPEIRSIVSVIDELRIPHAIVACLGCSCSFGLFMSESLSVILAVSCKQWAG